MNSNPARPRLPRRAFLRMASAVLLAGPEALDRLTEAARSVQIRDAWWLGLWSDEPSARLIGQACVGAVCDDRDATALAASIAARVPDVTARSVGVRRAALGARVRQDFAEGLTVWVDGWLLSTTEARLYALTALEIDIGRG